MIRLLVLFVVSLVFSPNHDVIVEDTCDYIEFNTFYNSGGVIGHFQVIFWEWKNGGVAQIGRDSTGKETGSIKYGPGFVGVAYRMMQSKPLVDYGYKNKRVSVLFWDKNSRVMRRVHGKWIIYTKGNDTEQENLELFPSRLRRGLFEPQ